jgi:adenosylcobinamide-phosphate synthase
MNERFLMRLAVLVIAFAVDFLVGDPEIIYHPVRIMGKFIGLMEKKTRNTFPKNRKGERAAGLLTWVVVTVLSFAVPFMVLRLSGMVNKWLAFGFDCFFAWQIIAAHSLRKESMRVYYRLKDDDLKGSREAISRIVGRDTEKLTPVEIRKAAVETVAENTSDGVIAPLIFMAIGASPLGMAYKAVNTMDSMVGYRNEKYADFGFFPAKLDDIFNYIPARITAVLMIISAPLIGLSSGGALKAYRADRNKHLSPNSGHPESACAGALGIELGGDSVYFGKVYKKATLGEARRRIETEDIRRSVRLMYAASLAGLVFISLILVLTGRAF